MEEGFMSTLDPKIKGIIQCELNRQRHSLELIASENFTSQAVLKLQGSVLTNKYAEGYPGKRYYGGCEFVDQIEELARQRLKQLFGAEHANVQPNAGSPANMMAYLSVMQPGDTLLGMQLSHGGHLTHGHPVNFSGKLFNVAHYTVDRGTELIDYEAVRRLAHEHKPKLIVSGASAYPRFIDFEAFEQIAQEVGAIHLCDMAHIAGLVAAGVHPSPVPHAAIVTTTTHKTLRGARGGAILCRQEYAKAIDKTVFPGSQGGPLMHAIAAKAQAFYEALQPEFKAYQQQTVANAKALASALAERGFRLVTGGTDNHLMLVDLTPKGVTGAETESHLEEVGITANKNAIPYDEKPPTVTSGIRFGTPALTSRGMQEAQMEEIAELIALVVENLGKKTEAAAKQEAIKRVFALCEAFPLYPDLSYE